MKILAFALLCLLWALPAEGARIGVYNQPEDARNGTFSVLDHVQLTPDRAGPHLLYFYVVVQVEGLVDAVAYQTEFSERVEVIGEQVTSDGLYFSTDNGHVVGLGGCFPGFNQVPIVVSRHEIFFNDRLFTAAASTELMRQQGPIPYPFVSLRPNPDGAPGDPLGAQYPMYSNCQDGVLPLTEVQDTAYWLPVATEQSSFGAVKSLFGGVR